MKLLKLVIVDDEPILLQGLLETYDWAGMGFKVAGTAQSGEQAIRVIKETRPHVVLTDIRMKQITGLMVMEEIQKTDLECLFIVLSAYRDFDYAQQACDLGAFAYLLKPIEDEKLRETMQSAYKVCMEQLENEERYERWEKLMVKDRISFLQLVIQKYIQNRIPEEQVEEVFRTLGEMPGNDEYFIGVCVDIDLSYKITNSLEYEASRFAVLKHLEEAIGNRYIFWKSESEGEGCLFVIRTSDNGAVRELKGLLERVKKEEKRIPFSAEKINNLLGTDIDEETMKGYFKMLDLGFDEETKEVIAPTWRQDLERLADIAEEVARFYGYDKIPTTLPSGEATTGKISFKLRVENVAREIAEFCGFSQGMTYSFESPKVFDKLLIPADSPLRNVVEIMNPLGEDYSIMRTTSLNGMLTSLATNYNRRNKDVRLYELGNIYLPKALPLTELPEERMQFTLGMYGGGDFFTMKGVVEEFFEKIGMKGREKYDPNAGKPYLHPGRQANIVYEGTVIGYMGEVHPTVAASYGIGDRAYVAVLDMPSIMKFATFDRKYEGIAKFPAVSRDISMVVPKNILAGQIEHIIAQRGGKILESYELFDIYEGSQIQEGYKSMAYSVTFRAKDRTLEDADVNAAMKKILNGLEGLGIELRK